MDNFPYEDQHEKQLSYHVFLSKTSDKNSTDESTTLPPSYDSLFGQFKEQKESSSFEFFKNVSSMFVSTVGCMLSLMILLALPMSMLVIGSKFKDDCPIEPFIPIYLIVGGSFGILKSINVILQKIIYQEKIFPTDVQERSEEIHIAWMLFDGVLNLFLFTWFLAGNIWVYSKYKPNFVPPPHQPMNYCNKVVYMFAFWVITSCYIVMVLICACTCCLGMCASCTAYLVTSNNPQNQQEEEINK